MKPVYFLLLLLIFYGCATLNRTTIEKTNRDVFQPFVLSPDFDISEIRIDIIRQTFDEQTNESIIISEEVPYHPVGFYLGNGLFMDLNDNLSLLVPKLFHIPFDESFTIEQSIQGSILKSAKTYEKMESSLTVKNEGLITTNTIKWISNKDSVISVRGGLFTDYRIIKSDSTITFDSGLANTVIHKNKEGYFYKTLFGKKEYSNKGKEILIGKKYIIRNLGDTIEILSNGLLIGEYLKYRIIKSNNRIFIFDRNYRGLEIIIAKDEINVRKNAKNLSKYSIK